MAQICVSGCRECDVCMECMSDGKPLHCPICGAKLDYNDKVYIVREIDEMVGCERCIAAMDADEVEERL